MARALKDEALSTGTPIQYAIMMSHVPETPQARDDLIHSKADYTHKRHDKHRKQHIQEQIPDAFEACAAF